jgi:hypothetical protein
MSGYTQEYAHWIKDGLAWRLMSDGHDDFWVESREVEGWMHYKDLSIEEADDLIESLQESA